MGLHMQILRHVETMNYSHVNSGANVIIVRKSWQVLLAMNCKTTAWTLYSEYARWKGDML